MYLDIESLSEEEFDRVVEFSCNEENLSHRYVVACNIIASMIENEDKIKESLIPYDGMVDLSICKMILDGVMEVEPTSKMLH
jgi:hypothetical protein